MLFWFYIWKFIRSSYTPLQPITLYISNMKSVCIRGLSEVLKCLLLKSDIRVVYRPHSTLRHQLVRAKNSLPSEKNSLLFMSSVYIIDQTGRSLGVRINEHRAAIRHSQAIRCLPPVLHWRVTPRNAVSLSLVSYQCMNWETGSLNCLK